MLKTFRVAELQELLGYANRSKSGRKHQLLGRALEMLKCDPGVNVRSKIRELYGNRYPRRLFVRQYEPPAVTYNSVGESSRNISVMPNLSLSSSSHSTSASSPSLPVHPDVKLRPLPFYDFKDVLVRPNTLVPVGKTRFDDLYIQFHLSPQQVTEIINSRDTRPNSNNEYAVQVLLRFCLLETSCEQDDLYPHSVCLKVNGKVCQLQGYLPPDNKGEKKKSGRPVDITSLCQLSPTVPNHIHVTWMRDSVQRFVVTVHLVHKVTSSCLVQRLKNRGRRNPDHSRALIKEKLTQDPDSEVATTSLRCSLMCPLGKTRMTLACRSKNCTHLQCFDGALYLQMNERKSRWICPVCDQEARFENLIIDGLFMEILEKAPQSNDIVFFSDGSWDAVRTSEPTSKVPSTLIPTPQHVEKPKPINGESLTKNDKSKCHVTIDLTLDSSDEDEDSDNHEDQMLPGLPFGAPSTRTTINTGQITTPFAQEFFPIANQSNVLPELGFDISSFFSVTGDAAPAFTMFTGLENAGLLGQTAAHAINLD